MTAGNPVADQTERSSPSVPAKDKTFDDIFNRVHYSHFSSSASSRRQRAISHLPNPSRSSSGQLTQRLGR
jgi:hypothetical protein